MRVVPNDLAALQRAAMGTQKSDFAIEQIQYLNVFSGEIYPAVVYVYDGFVCHVDHFCQKADAALTNEILDGGNRFLIPGLIDSHTHIESSMCTPRNYARAVAPHGTTTVITDPHEIGNVLGEEGVRYMVESSEGLPMRQLIDIPSCVPSVPGLECAGAEFDADTVTRLAKLPRTVGLAEVMDFVGVALTDERMASIIQSARDAGLYLQGHIPASDPRLISAYIIGGPETCHETRVGEDGAKKIRAGLFVDARQSSISQDLIAILDAVKDMRYFDRLCFCTDDKEADDIIALGHLNDSLRIAVKNGFNAVDAVRCCTLNPARAARLENIGAVAPGYTADMLLVDDLVDFAVNTVFFGGKVVAKDGVLLADIDDTPYACEQPTSMNIARALTPEDFLLKAPDSAAASVRMNVLSYASDLVLLADSVPMELPMQSGVVDISGNSDLAYVIVINRYGKPNIARGLIQNFGLKKGANASTVSHDCHNLCIVYRDPQDAYRAYRELVACGGGMCCADGENVTLIPLPVAGLMSDKSCRDVAGMIQQFKEALWSCGMPQKNPMMRITTLALPVIPNAKYSDLGLVDVMKKELIEIFPA